MKKIFPDKSEKEIKAMSKKFYRHFVDLVIESVKNFTISEENALKRMKCLNPEVLDAFYDNNQSVIICGSHYNNWELWAVAINPQVKHKVLGIYKKLSNDFFDQKMRESRGRFGLDLVTTREAKDLIEKKSNELIAPVFAIDQSPADPKKSLWIDFMNVDTACYYGAEKYAKDYNLPVICCSSTKVKRGYYTCEFKVISDDPRNVEYGSIIKEGHNILEAQILDHPEFWLWTHKRWKHKRPVEV